MNFEWSTNDIITKTITIYHSNLTLNKAACQHFENVQYVLLGLDKKDNILGIKPVTKEQLETNVYPVEQLHRISIGKSYGRISNKNFIATIIQAYHLDVKENQGIKYSANFDVIHQILVVHLEGE
jgi:hypothetical protein